MRAFMWTLAFLGLAALPLAGQSSAGPGEDRLTVSLMGGTLQGAEELSHDTDFEAGPVYGLGLTYWHRPWLGLRARGLRGTPRVRTEDFALSRLDPDIWLLSGEVVVRRPFLNQGRMIAPYLAGGIGAKRYGFEDPYHAPAVTVGGGVEVRMARYGVFAEATHVFSELHRIGFQEGTRDWALTGGVSLSLGGGEGPLAAVPDRYHPAGAGL